MLKEAQCRRKAVEVADMTGYSHTAVSIRIGRFSEWGLGLECLKTTRMHAKLKVVLKKLWFYATECRLKRVNGVYVLTNKQPL